MLDHVVFLVSGWAMTSATQLETYWGGNRDVGMLLGLFQYLGMAALIFLPSGWQLFQDKQLQRHKLRLILPIALSDLSDTFFLIYGINVRGSAFFQSVERN